MAGQQFSIEIRNDHLFITLPPYTNVSETKSQIAQIHAAIDSSGCRKVLIDITSTKDKIPVFDLFDICLYVVEKLGPSDPKIAVLASMEAVYEDRFGENVIRNRGVDLIRFTTTLKDSLDWLNSSHPPS